MKDHLRAAGIHSVIDFAHTIISKNFPDCRLLTILTVDEKKTAATGTHNFAT